MYKLDVSNQQLVSLTPRRFSDLGVRERFDLQEWIEKSPDILDEDLLIIAKELILPSGIRLDLLALDKQANLVVIELKRDDSGSDVEWQAIKYASYCSNFLPDHIFETYARYLGSDTETAQLQIEGFIDEELEMLNQEQRVILVAKEFHPDVASAVLWLRDYKIEIKCVRLRTYVDADGDVFITPDVIIPLPEAKDYIERKEDKRKEVAKRSGVSSFALDRGTFDQKELEQRLRATLARPTILTPRFVRFLEILLSEHREFGRDEVQQKLFEKGVGTTLGQTGNHLSGLSRLLTNHLNPHLRQIITFASDGYQGAQKDQYRVVTEYRELVRRLVDEYNNKSSEAESLSTTDGYSGTAGTAESGS